MSVFIQLKQKPLSLPVLPVLYASQELLQSQPVVQGEQLHLAHLLVWNGFTQTGFDWWKRAACIWRCEHLEMSGDENS